MSNKPYKFLRDIKLPKLPYMFMTRYRSMVYITELPYNIITLVGSYMTQYGSMV